MYETDKNIHLKNGIYLISAVTEKGHNAEEEDEAEAKAGPSKTRSSSETTRVSANLASIGLVKETQCQRDKSNEDLRENHEECEYFGLLSSLYKDRLHVYSLISLTPSLTFE